MKKGAEPAASWVPGGLEESPSLFSGHTGECSDPGRSDSERSDPVLSAGMLLAERYQIIRQIGRGGMGEVYEALDLDLKVKVALKIVRPVLASDWKTMEYFRREITLSRRIAHPNVCRVFEFGRHSDGRLDVTFLTMELLEGETLETRIRRKQKMTVEEALPVIRQIAEALSAAHSAGIVHRDFKPSNVMLVPGKEGERVVVTDFGLAKSLETGESALSASSGLLVGTAAYMSPEQASGGKTGPASDVYAFGAVIYEMVTGELPHRGSSAIELLVKRLNEPPAPPRHHNPDLPARWEHVILCCLAKEPSRRLRTARDVALALENAEYELPEVPPEPERRPVHPTVPGDLSEGAGILPVPKSWARGPRFQGIRNLLIAVAFCGLLVAAVVFWRTAGKGRPLLRAGERRSVAVLGFRNLAGKPDTGWLSAALTEMLGAELCVGGALRIVPSENVNRMKAELGLSDAESYTKETLERIRANLDAETVVVGSYLALDAGNASPLRVDIRLQDSGSGETLGTVSENRTVAAIYDVVTKTGIQLRSSLGVAQASGENSTVMARLPKDTRAARLYSEGLTRLAKFDLLEARDLFQQALEIDPASAPAHAALAETFQTLGEERKAEAAARKAFENASPLAREERLRIEGQFYETSRQWEKAIDTYKTLFNFFPDDIEHGLRLVRAETSAADSKRASKTIAELRAVKTSSATDPRIDLAEAEVAAMKGDLKRAVGLSVAAEVKARARGARLLVASSLARQSHTELLIGAYDISVDHAREAQAIFKSLGHAIGALQAAETRALATFMRGRLDEALSVLEESLADARKLASRKFQSRILGSLGGVHLQLGEISESQLCFEESLVLATALEHKQGVAAVVANLGEVLAAKGQLTAARRQYDNSQALFKQIGDRWRAAAVTVNLGDLDRDSGNIARARTHYEEALSTLRMTGNSYYLPMVLQSLGELALAEGKLSDAQVRLTEAVGIRKETGEKIGLAQSQVAMAALALEEGHSDQAKEYASSARALFNSAGSKEGEAEALRRLAQVSLAQGRIADAESEINAARLLITRNGRVSTRFSVSIMSARIAMTKEPKEAREALLAITKELEASELRLIALEARLALAEAERACGNEARSRQLLTAIVKEARERGCGLLERKAASLQRA